MRVPEAAHRVDCDRGAVHEKTRRRYIDVGAFQTTVDAAGEVIRRREGFGANYVCLVIDSDEVRERPADINCNSHERVLAQNKIPSCRARVQLTREGLSIRPGLED